MSPGTMTHYMPIQSDLSLVGAGADRTIVSGNYRVRLVHVFSNAAAEIIGITLAEGHAPDGGPAVWDDTPAGDGGHGGGILNEGVLLVQQCTIRDSLAGDGGGLQVPFPLPQAGTAAAGKGRLQGGTAAPGEMTGEAGTGGGIFNSGLLTITQSAIISNSAGYSGWVTSVHYDAAGNGGDGGGIFNAAILHLQNSTISHNWAPNGGDAFGPFYYSVAPGYGGWGGGLVNTGIATLDNTTLVANRAGSGGTAYQEMYDGGWIVLHGSDGVGGGLVTFGLTDTLTLRNTVLTNNVGDGKDCAGTLTTQGFNLIQDASSCTIAGASEGDRLGLNPLLFPLDAYSGTTPVHPPSYLSPVVDKGSCIDSRGAVVAVDQQGTLRPRQATCDIGAYEAMELAGTAFLPLVERR